MNKINKLLSLLCMMLCCSLFYSNAMENRKQSDEKIIPFDKLNSPHSPINLDISNNSNYKLNLSLPVKTYDFEKLNEENIKVNIDKLSILVHNCDHELIFELEQSNFAKKVFCENNDLSFQYKSIEDLEASCMKIGISLKKPKLIFHKIIESNNNVSLGQLNSNNEIGYCYQSDSKNND